ncbi:hypothetical protein [Flavobacterium wongokense]|uniref:hypothetical protein n=1 Tax=Flavobacterium wongokense TaxID=2910674 RepID=UPI001F2C392F|nr:hypothetical protein [Flavobacterium sp. WG47]MCF6131316.1 hypothetical protein [Flavobacterium sp. WG47]
MKKIYLIIPFVIALLTLTFVSCTDSDDEVVSEPKLIIKFKFDPNQARLNNLGQPSTVAAGNAAQSPIFNSISSHYIELAPNANTQLGQGVILYHAPETTVGGGNAIDFAQSTIVAQDETFLEIPLSQVAAGSYEWMRVSLSYQNYQINVRSAGVDYAGTLASFVGYNTYINTFNIGNAIFPVNGNRAQGYWAFALNDNPYSTSGQAPAGATTVPNPIAATSPIPSGSCVVTGRFASNLVIDGTETNDVVVTLSLSINNSFEWHEVNADGKFEPSAGENVVDMGLRGLIPTYVK